MPHVFITSHLGGETRSYERNVVEILLENLTRLWNGETQLRNQIV
jgi:D-2-hydroxyacid dehydrogenase (NADP+)